MAKGLDAGNAYVTVMVDTSKFTRDLNSNVKQSMKGVEQTTGKSMAGVGGVAGTMMKTGALAAGAVAVGAIVQIGKMGMEYQNSLNIFQAATGATVAQMDKVKVAARALGNDITLPGVSAKDAAAAMTELAKGGLNVEQSMMAAKGTMQLATAAQIDGAQAAEIQANALAMFGLKADKAAHVADVLANVANAASGEITDFALSMKYVGPIAKSLGISIDDTAAAMGVLANNGIKGEMAGTALRGMLSALASPSEGGAEALEKLGVKAFDASGKFVGMRTVIGQLTAAQGRMTDKQFAANATLAFGREAISAINVVAGQGPAAFDAMAKSVGQSGGAAKLAAAKSKGLAGAWDSLVSTVETAGLQIYDKFAPGIEKALRGFGEVLPGVIDDLGAFADKALSTFEDIGESPVMLRIGEAVAKNTPLMEDGMRKMGESAELFGKNFTEQFTKVVDSKTMTDIVDSIQRIVDVIDGPLKKAWEANKGAMGWIGTALGFLVGTSFKQFQGALNLVADAVEFLGRNMGNIVNFATGWVGALVAVWDAIWAAGKAVLQASTLWIDSLLAGWDATWNVGKAVLDFITGTWWPGVKASWDAFKAIIVAVAGAVWAGVLRIIGFYAALGRGIMTAIRTLWTFVTTLFKTMWTTVTSAVRTGIATVVGFFTGLKTKVVGALSTAGTWLYNAGRNIIDGIVRGIRGVLSWVSTAVGGVKAKVTGAISGAASWLTGVGKDIIRGIVSGLNDGKQWIADKIAELKRLIPDWAQKAMGIKSPSKVMLYTGRMIGAGLAAGIDQSGSLVEKAVDRLAGTATAAITAAPVTVPVVAADVRDAARTTARPAGQVRRAGAAATAAPVHITVNGALDPNAVGRQIVDLLRRENRLRATPVMTVG
jgi:TP901 family phage tail tape measure protein